MIDQCICPYHKCLLSKGSMQITGVGSFALLPRCPQVSQPTVMRILAVVSHSKRLKFVNVKSDANGQIYIDCDMRHKFSSDSDLIKYLESGRLVLMLSDGESVQPVRHCAGNRGAVPPHQNWYHPDISPAEAKAFVSAQPLGAFLVCPLSQGADSGPLALCVHGEDNAAGCFKIRVRQSGDRQSCFITEEIAFTSVADLVEFYTSRSLADSCQRRYRLIKPIDGTAFVAKLVTHRVEDLLARDGIRAEFKEICETSRANAGSKSVAQKPENSRKNRYQNVLPFDETRLVLDPQGYTIPTGRRVASRQSTGTESFSEYGDGYINASRIQPDPTGPVYIAAQGPLENTRGDFWLMAWQENVRVVVMATKELENRKRKCQRYWPTRAERILEVVSSDTTLTVEHLGDTDLHHFSDTKLAVARWSAGEAAAAGPSRIIHLLRYHDWPDHGAPKDVESVLNLLDYANQMNGETGDASNTESGGASWCLDLRPPLLIHCSAGLGRTGCLIAIDSLLHRIKSHDLQSVWIDVCRTVKQMRGQRDGMVQNFAQYRFIYAALTVRIDCILRPWVG